MIVAWNASVIILGVLIFGATLRLMIGPTAPDRVVALDAINTLVVAILIILGALYRQPVFVDVAIVYALLSFVGTLYIARFLKRDYL
ncbi:cation:proton antiporter [candidate division FCPU426 bacterium]|nr:cation:proton antiporter [candidate division FCPU426 bacterium]